MAGSVDVDYLIGLGKASCHPIRFERAKHGGNLWIWNNKFGSCLGGSHPLKSAYHKQYTHLYMVLKTLAAEDPLVGRSPSCGAFPMETLTNEAKDSASRGWPIMGTSQSYGHGQRTGCPDNSQDWFLNKACH